MKIPVGERSKKVAKDELNIKFGFNDTAGFRKALRNGEIEKCEIFLTFIEADLPNYPQYIMTWWNWLADREREIAQARAAQ